MYQQRQKFQNVFLLIIDEVCLIGSYYLSAFLRLKMWNSTNEFNITRLNGSLWAIFLAYFCVFFFFNMNQYLLKRGWFEELIYVIKVNIFLAVVLTTISFMSKNQILLTRGVWVLTIALNVLLMYIGHVLAKLYLLKVEQKRHKNHLYLVTTSDRVEKILQKMRQEYDWESHIISIALIDKDMAGESIQGMPVVASFEDMYEFARREVVDEVYINISYVTGESLRKYVREFETMGITVHLNINVLEGEEGFERQINMIGDSPVVSFAPRFFDYNKMIIKRMIDIAGGLVGMAITVIVGILLAPPLLIESPGPLIFKQKRVGKNGRYFYIYKFRSMYKDAEERKKQLMKQNEMKGPMFKLANDPRVTKIGKFIRSTSIDELPQFWNVLKGDMSLVGTRPPTVKEFKQYAAYHKRRLSMKPGLTGMWQISGRSDIKDFEEVVKLDLQYIDNWSLALDLRILLKTIPVVVGRIGSR